MKNVTDIHFIFVSALLLSLNNQDNQGGVKGSFVESGCKGDYRDQNQNFLDLIQADYDICIKGDILIFLNLSAVRLEVEYFDD